MISSNNFDSLHNISLGKHLYQFYKNSEDFFHVTIPFFEAGLKKNQVCLWLVSDRIGVDIAKATAEAMIFDCDQYFSAGQFQIQRAEDWYLSNGQFDEAKAIQNAENHVGQLKNGQILRGAGDGGCFQRKDWPEVFAYEKKMDIWVKTKPVIGLCAYPILECTPSQTKQILECHEDVLIGKM